MPTPHLPTELLEDIFSQLSSSKSALYSLSLSCKTFYFLCKPFLYSDLTITNKIQRERLLQVRTEDARLVRKLVIRGRKKAASSNGTDGVDCTLGSKIIEDLFVGTLLDISAIEILHAVRLYEKSDDQEDPESLKMLSASNLVELSIREHGGGGSLWRKILAEVQICPKLVRLGYGSVTSYRQNRISNPDSTVARSSSYYAVLAHLHLNFHGQLEVLSSFAVTDETRGEGNLRLYYFSNMSKLHHVVRTLTVSRHLHVISESYAQPPPLTSVSSLSKKSVAWKIETPAFLSLPFSRAALTSDALAILSLVSVLGVELHYVDEEEDDSISLIPRSFVKFVEKQKKLKEEEKEKEKEKEKEEAA